MPNRLRFSCIAVCSGIAVAGATVLGLPEASARIADAARAVAGDRAVADLEDLVYGARDRIDLLRHEGDRPEARWLVPVQPVSAPEPEAAAREPEAWSPRDVGPVHGDFSAEGNGVWVPMAHGDGAPVMKKTLLHPDRARAFAELFVVAIDVSATTLHYVPGTEEPESVSPEADRVDRHGDVPEHDREALLAAWNGGFKTRHGRHGVEVDGTTIVPLKDGLCTLTATAEGEVLLGALDRSALPERPAFVRQSARCLVENGTRHPGLVQELTASWGAAVGGETVIRRSAVGLDAERKTLFVGVSNRTTATALADGMRHAGAVTAAQLDVNEAFPRFLTYRRDERGALVADSIAAGFHYRKGHYVDAASSRDFFYLTRKAPPRVASAGPASPAAVLR